LVSVSIRLYHRESQHVSWELYLRQGNLVQLGFFSALSWP
jgi:hypothetical protein